MSNANQKIGLIGTGYWGKNLLRNFDALNALAGFFDISSESRAHYAAQFPNAREFENLDAMLADETIPAVAIATPAVTHGSMVERALQAGKHVFVEKPLCLDVAEAEQLKKLADEKGLVLMVGHLLLYHPAFLALFEIVKSGRMGKLRYIYSNRLSLGKIRREENALWSFAPHDISMILQLADDMPRRVVATGAQFLTDGVADTTLSHLVFNDNLQAHIYVSWLHPFKEQKLVVVGDKAMVVFDDTKDPAEKILLYRHEVGWEGDIPIVSKAAPEPIFFAESEPLRNECQAFLDAVSGTSRPPSDAAEGIRVLRVLDACQQSILQGQAVDLAPL
ncbi:MAG: Gfo/Idh/MocA family oxidoreductase [Proteobacteria bacterium]|nr:Gfo/Idh/MocA family oxidoreductase [Pseudomonadota bacterium]MDA1357668.1 Gfo/Idh/MocA family oxidoreductase [Pseudomonadota bacterium]